MFFFAFIFIYHLLCIVIFVLHNMHRYEKISIFAITITNLSISKEWSYARYCCSISLFLIRLNIRLICYFRQLPKSHILQLNYLVLPFQPSLQYCTLQIFTILKLCSNAISPCTFLMGKKIKNHFRVHRFISTLFHLCY